MDVADLVRPYPKELAIQRAEYAAILAERAAAAKASIPQPRAPRASSPQHSAIPRSPAKSQPKASGDQYFYEFLLPDDAYLRHDLLGEKSSRFRQMSEQAGLAHPAYVNDAGYLRVFGGEGSIRNLLQEYNDLMKVYTARDPFVLVLTGSAEVLNLALQLCGSAAYIRSFSFGQGEGGRARLKASYP